MSQSRNLTITEYLGMILCSKYTKPKHTWTMMILEEESIGGEWISGEETAEEFLEEAEIWKKPTDAM